jgi:hypothetical protein
MLMVIVGLGSVCFYVVTAGVVNAQPTTQPFDGWLATLQKDDEPGPEQMTLWAMAVEPGAPGGRPVVRYSIVVCGSRPFHGVLLIGGQARLDHPSVITPSQLPGREIRELRGASLALFDTTIDLGSVQSIEVNIKPSGPCVSAPGGKVLGGTVYAVEGRVRAPIQHQARFFGVDTARHSEVWPRVGGLPGVADGTLGVFDGSGELSGSWVIPPGMRCRVSGGTLSAKAIVDVAVPPLPEASTVDWDKAGPIAPTVRITNVDEMASVQHTLTAAGVALGIGGSLLASLLFEMVKSHRRATLAPPATGSAPTPTPRMLPRTGAPDLLNTRPVSRRWTRLAIGTGVLLLARMLWHWRRRQ